MYTAVPYQLRQTLNLTLSESAHFYILFYHENYLTRSNFDSSKYFGYRKLGRGEIFF